MAISPSFSSGAFKSTNWLSNLPANAFLRSPGLIDAATSSVVVPLGNSFIAPSGNFSCIVSDMLNTPFLDVVQKDFLNPHVYHFKKLNAKKPRPMKGTRFEFVVPPFFLLFSPRLKR